MKNLMDMQIFTRLFVSERKQIAFMADAIHQSGKWYTNENIDQMLMERHLAKKARRGSSKHHLKGPSKRTAEDDQRFEESFEKLLCKAML